MGAGAPVSRPSAIYRPSLALLTDLYEVTMEPPPLAEARDRARRQLARFHAGIKRFVNPHEYPVGLERRLHDLRLELTLAARQA
jgi:hypothetical protein